MFCLAPKQASRYIKFIQHNNIATFLQLIQSQKNVFFYVFLLNGFMGFEHRVLPRIKPILHRL